MEGGNATLRVPRYELSLGGVVEWKLRKEGKEGRTRGDGGFSAYCVDGKAATAFGGFLGH